MQCFLKLACHHQHYPRRAHPPALHTFVLVRSDGLEMFIPTLSPILHTYLSQVRRPQGSRSWRGPCRASMWLPRQFRHSTPYSRCGTGRGHRLYDIFAEGIPHWQPCSSHFGLPPQVMRQAEPGNGYSLMRWGSILLRCGCKVWSVTPLPAPSPLDFTVCVTPHSLCPYLILPTNHRPEVARLQEGCNTLESAALVYVQVRDPAGEGR